MVSILVIDNFDSFVFNLVQYLQQLDATVNVIRNDVVRTADLVGYDGLMISPGPGTPSAAGYAPQILAEVAGSLPVLGVCLGHQMIGEMYGAVVNRAPELMHGKTSMVLHEGAGVLAGLPQPFRATRYHSLAIEADTINEELEVTGRTENGIVMAVRHRTLPIEGVQFHPESVLTEGGHRLLANWLAMCGDAGAPERSESLAVQVDTSRSSALLDKL
jgi:para-aminobenzoate synthetase component 2